MHVAALAVGVGLALLAGCEGLPTDGGATPGEPAAKGAVSTTVAMTGLRGDGAIGTGEPTADGKKLQEFVFDVGADLTGRLDYVDHAVIKADGNPARLVAGPDVPGTAVSEFAQTSTACATFAGVGKVVNTGELVDFRVEACDYGSPGVPVDEFGIRVEWRTVSHGSPYERYDKLSEGDVVRETL